MENRCITLSNGVKMPILGFGTYGLSGKQAYTCVKEALEVGYRMIDTAHMYGNEKEVGKAIHNSQIPREQIFVVTKMDSRSNSYEKAKGQIKKSLTDLNLTYIDLYLIHEPYSKSLEMWKALEEAYQQGTLKSIGISNFLNTRFDGFLKNVKILPMVNQVETHIYSQRLQVQKIFSEKGVALMSWSPLIGGEVNFYSEPILIDLAKKYNKTVAQIVLNYFASRNIIIIPRTSKKERMIENMNIFDFDLNEEEVKKIQTLDRNESLFSWAQQFES